MIQSKLHNVESLGEEETRHTLSETSEVEPAEEEETGSE